MLIQLMQRTLYLLVIIVAIGLLTSCDGSSDFKWSTNSKVDPDDVTDSEWTRVNYVLFVAKRTAKAMPNAKDVDIAPLRRMRNLKYIALNDTKITDSALRHLSNLAQLEELSVANTRVSDVGLKHLYGLTNLKVFNVQDTRVTEQGVADLKAKLPRVQVAH